MAASLEKAVADWYRGVVRTRAARVEDSSGLVEQIDSELDATGEVSRQSRLLLDELGRTAAAGVSHAQRWDSKPRELAASVIRMFRGHEPYLHASQVEAPETNVLHAIADLRMGGAQQLVIDVLRTAPGNSVHQVICRSISRTYRPGVKHRALPVQVDAIRRHIDALDPELVHVCHYHASLPSLAWYEAVFQAAITSGRPVVQSHCVIGDPWMGSNRQHLVFCSEWSMGRSGVPEIPGTVINPGSPAQMFLAPRRALSDSLRIGMAYRLVGDKIDVSAADAIIQVLKQVPAARMCIAGDGNCRAALEAGVREAGFADRVDWLGYVPFDALPDFYRGLDLAIAPVIADTFGSGSVHAILSGTPVVGYGVAAIPEILVSDETLVAPGDSVEMGRKVAAILEDDALHARLHAAQLERSMKHFGIEQMAGQYHRLFREVADQSGHSSSNLH